MKKYLCGIQLFAIVFRIMKYSCCIFLLIVLGTQLLFSAPSSGQALKEIKMDLTIQNGSLKDALMEIKQKNKAEACLH